LRPLLRDGDKTHPIANLESLGIRHFGLRTYDENWSDDDMGRD
jgi:hypothetical protein